MCVWHPTYIHAHVYYIYVWSPWPQWRLRLGEKGRDRSHKRCALHRKSREEISDIITNWHTCYRHTIIKVTWSSLSWWLECFCPLPHHHPHSSHPHPSLSHSAVSLSIWKEVVVWWTCSDPLTPLAVGIYMYMNHNSILAANSMGLDVKSRPMHRTTFWTQPAELPQHIQYSS